MATGGGSVSAGKAYRVGEMGPEMFVPTMPGHIIPSANGHDTSDGMGGGARINIGGTVIQINGNADALTVAAFRDEMSSRDKLLGTAIDLRFRDRIKRGAY